MPVHDWGRVPAGILHAFHHEPSDLLHELLKRGAVVPGAADVKPYPTGLCTDSHEANATIGIRQAHEHRAANRDAQGNVTHYSQRHVLSIVVVACGVRQRADCHNPTRISRAAFEAATGPPTRRALAVPAEERPVDDGQEKTVVQANLPKTDARSGAVHELQRTCTIAYCCLPTFLSLPCRTSSSHTACGNCSGGMMATIPD